MTNEEINQALAVCEEARPGDWRADGVYVYGRPGTVIGHFVVAADATLVAQARTLLPRALTELRAAQGQICRLVSDGEIESDHMCWHDDRYLALLAERDTLRAALAEALDEWVQGPMSSNGIKRVAELRKLCGGEDDIRARLAGEKAGG